MKRCLFPTVVLLAIFGLIGCSASTTATPPPTPQVLFVGNGRGVVANRGKIFYFGFPVTSTSTPAFVLTAGVATSALESFAQDATYDYVADCTPGLIRAALRPLTSASTQAFALAAAGPDGIAVDSSGNLYAGEDCSTDHIDVWNGPITSASTVSVSETDSTVTTRSLQQMFVDNVNHLLYVANCETTNQVLVYALPLTNTSTASVHMSIAGVSCVAGIALNPVTNQLFVANELANIIYVFGLPISNSSTPVLTITTSTAAQRFINLAFDRTGNLFASDRANASIHVFVPPFSAGGDPAFSLTPTGIDQPWGLNVGFP